MCLEGKDKYTCTSTYTIKANKLEQLAIKESNATKSMEIRSTEDSDTEITLIPVGSS